MHLIFIDISFNHGDAVILWDDFEKEQ